MQSTGRIEAYSGETIQAFIQKIREDAVREALEEKADEIERIKSKWNEGGMYYSNVTEALNEALLIINKHKNI